MIQLREKRDELEKEKQWKWSAERMQLGFLEERIVAEFPLLKDRCEFKDMVHKVKYEDGLVYTPETAPVTTPALIINLDHNDAIVCTLYGHPDLHDNVAPPLYRKKKW